MAWRELNSAYSRILRSSPSSRMPLPPLSLEGRVAVLEKQDSLLQDDKRALPRKKTGAIPSDLTIYNDMGVRVCFNVVSGPCRVPSAFSGISFPVPSA